MATASAAGAVAGPYGVMDGTGPLLLHVPGSMTASGPPTAATTVGGLTTAAATAAPSTTATTAAAGKALGTTSGLTLGAKSAAVTKLTAIGGLVGGGAVAGFLLVAGSMAAIGYVGYKAAKALKNTAEQAKK